MGCGWDCGRFECGVLLDCQVWFVSFGWRSRFAGPTHTKTSPLERC